MTANSKVAPATNQAGEVEIEWRCFHCGEAFTDERCARLHFGRDEDSAPACQIKAGAEQGLLGALRDAEYAAADAMRAIADECTDAAKAYYSQMTRHNQALRNAEELGYERGLADARSLATQPATSPCPDCKGTGYSDGVIPSEPELCDACETCFGEGVTTQPATSQEGEAQQWRHKLWMVACHATGGGIPEIEGIDRSVNDICVQITQSRNAIYQAGKDAALTATPTPPAETREAELQAEIERLRGLLIDPGDPAWEDARAVLVAELRKNRMETHADNIDVSHAVPIPSWIALNLIAHARLAPTPLTLSEDLRKPASALIQRMADRETDRGGCLDITAWLIEADRIAALAREGIMSAGKWAWWAGRNEEEFTLAGPCRTRDHAIIEAYGDTEPGDMICLIEAIDSGIYDESTGLYPFLETRNASHIIRREDPELVQQVQA